MFKKILPLCLAFALVFSLAACAPTTTKVKTPEELKALYTESINAARDAELNEVIPALTATTDPLADMILPMVGLDDAALSTAFAVAISAMNVQAYGVVAVMPAQDKAADVKAALQSFIDLQITNFTTYLPDQLEIAKAAKLETLADGTILMVMCPDQDTIFNSIKAAIEK